MKLRIPQLSPNELTAECQAEWLGGHASHIDMGDPFRDFLIVDGKRVAYSLKSVRTGGAA